LASFRTAFPRLRAELSSIPARLRRRPSGGVYQAEIDGLRFFAIAIVVVGHLVERALRFFPSLAAVRDNPFVAGFARPGFGVYLFFSISGFILATQAMKAKDSPLSGRFLRAYFGRRLLRIEPPYLLLLLATWAAISLTGYSPENTRHFDAGPDSLTLSLAGSAFYLHDLIWGEYPRLFPPGWSLEIEVQFYLLAPLLFFAYFGMKRGPARRLLGWAALLLGVLSSLYAPRRIGVLWTGQSLLQFFHYFWLGILLADLRPALAEWTRRVPPWAASLAGFGALLVFMQTPNAPDAPATVHELALALSIRAMSLASVTVLFACALAPAGAFRRFCSLPWISLIGGACYSIYLIHLQALHAMTAQIARHAPDSGVATLVLYGAAELAAVVGIGLVFYVLIERPFMNPHWPDDIRRKVSGRAPADALAPRQA
jgi:peptidoglycan/LPS O-acetylase OafA/YrhL